MLAGVPDLILEAFGTTVKMIGTVVDWKTVCLSTYLEMSSGNAVGITSGALSCARAVAYVVACLAVTEDYVAQFALAVGNIYRNYTRTYVAEFDISS